jgi:cell division protein FtsN
VLTALPARSRAVTAAVAVAALLLLPTAARRVGAQSPAGPPGGAAQGPYERALRLVESGYGAEGRALTDSLVGAATPGSPALGETLWWRASLAADAAASERDLRRLMLEVPASPRAGQAAVRLAQLAVLRNRLDDAVALLEPLVRREGDEPARALAGYWLARARLDRRDVAGACSALAGAAGASAADAELARQLGALRQRVPGCAGPVVASAPPPSSSAPASGVASPPVAVAAPMREGTPRDEPARVAPTSTAVPLREVPPSTPAPSAPAPSAPAPSAPAPSSAAPSSAAPAPSGASTGTRVPAEEPVRPAPSTPIAPATGGARFTVQVAAYDTRAGAAELAARLRSGGFEAYVEGQGPADDRAPFRVKVGRHATRAAAVEALGTLRQRGLGGFVTTARPAASPAAP